MGREKVKRIAALYVMRNGPYSKLSFVDLWDEVRDARKYKGKFPVIAHPPCARWGRYWWGGPTSKKRYNLGDDDGCFDAAIKAVRSWGGVLEHPEATYAWKEYGIKKPPREGGWIKAGDGIGFTCCVEQGNYGHKARKATWLYGVSIILLNLNWGFSPAKGRVDHGFHTNEERKRLWEKRKNIYILTHRERLETPIAFRDLLISLIKEKK